MENTKVPVISAKDLNLWYGDFKALKGISLDVGEREITALIGPSGCGKSTFLKTLNRMNDLVPNVRIEGDVRLKGEDIFAREMCIRDSTWGVFDGETLAAYLLMVRPAGSRVSQLDYFAVLPEYRAAGLGAQLLADLPQHERGAQALSLIHI